MKKFAIAIAADHRGFKAKQELIEYLQDFGHEVIDVGTDSGESCDHPDYAFKAGELMIEGKAQRAIVICGSGNGMLIALSKVPGVMPFLPYDEEHTRTSRMHNDTNGISFGSDFMSVEKMKSILKVWLETDHIGGRYSRRRNKILEYERKKINNQS